MDVKLCDRYCDGIAMVICGVVPSEKIGFGARTSDVQRPISHIKIDCRKWGGATGAQAQGVDSGGANGQTRQDYYFQFVPDRFPLRS
ncbi:hypothetical protein EVAR_45910_1 [Eumeta japonica]|uniref:Uncharacterized protein n=1 Tax=Eumeta variegata TaxID=151549 RepID=A0A4C1XUV3_EUMVA|nr:hypothetical protein EVAR_45910_1 [Eumeta japonica]